jgi:hypothetical protein
VFYELRFNFFQVGPSDDQKIHEIVAQVPWPIEVVDHTWEPYMGQPMVQKVPGETMKVPLCL